MEILLSKVEKKRCFIYIRFEFRFIILNGFKFFKLKIWLKVILFGGVFISLEGLNVYNFGF